jgi:segregation and condensation protein B
MSNEINLFAEDVETASKSDLRDAELVDLLDKIRSKQEATAQNQEARKHIKIIIESLLFATNDPITFKKIREVTDTLHPLKPRVLTELIEELKKEYLDTGRGFELAEANGGYILRTRPEYGKFVDLLYLDKRSERLSAASTEVLAIIAYKGPITRSQVDEIRGVDSSGTVYALLERELVVVVGKKDSPGRPSLLSVTPKFLNLFGLTDLKELPQLTQS